MRMSWLLLLLVFNFTFNNVSDARHLKKKLPSAVVVGTVYCDTCFHQEFSKYNHFISGALVAVECGDSSASNPSFYKEVKTDKKGEFKVNLPLSISKHVKKIEGCSVKLIRSSEPYCAVASSATSSSLRLKSKEPGTHIFSAGFFTFKPLNQPLLCNQKPSIKNYKETNSLSSLIQHPNDNSFPPPLQDPPEPFIPPLPELPRIPPLPTIPVLPPGIVGPPAQDTPKSAELSDLKSTKHSKETPKSAELSDLKSTKHSKETPKSAELSNLKSTKNTKETNSLASLIQHPNDFSFPPTLQGPPVSFLPPLPQLPQLPPLPTLPFPSPSPGAVGLPAKPTPNPSEIFNQKTFGFPFPPNPLLPPPSLLPPLPFQPPPSIIPPIFPSPPPSIFPPFTLPPLPGLIPSPPPPPPSLLPPFPHLPPFPFQPAPGFPGVPPASSSKKPSP